MKDGLAEKKPKPSIVKTIMSTLKSSNDCAAFATHVAAISSFVDTNFPGLLE